MNEMQAAEERKYEQENAEFRQRHIELEKLKRNKDWNRIQFQSLILSETNIGDPAIQDERLRRAKKLQHKKDLEEQVSADLNSIIFVHEMCA